MYAHIHIYPYIYTHIQMYIYIYTYIHVHIYVYKYNHMYTYMNIYIHTYMHINVHVHIFTCLCITFISQEDPVITALRERVLQQQDIISKLQESARSDGLQRTEVRDLKE